jgi:hypothetical protein
LGDLEDEAGSAGSAGSAGLAGLDCFDRLGYSVVEAIFVAFLSPLREIVE